MSKPPPTFTSRQPSAPCLLLHTRRGARWRARGIEPEMVAGRCRPRPEAAAAAGRGSEAPRARGKNISAPTRGRIHILVLHLFRRVCANSCTCVENPSVTISRPIPPIPVVDPSSILAPTQPLYCSVLYVLTCTYSPDRYTWPRRWLLTGAAAAAPRDWSWGIVARHWRGAVRTHWSLPALSVPLSSAPSPPFPPSPSFPASFPASSTCPSPPQPTTRH